MSGRGSLADSRYFDGFSEGALCAIRRAGRLVRLGPDEVVLRPGEHHHALHFVLAGTLEVRLEAKSVPLSRIRAGECFGEMSLVDGEPASAWVVSVGPCELLRVSEDKVWSELLPQPAFARGLLRLLSRRLRQGLERQASLEQLRRELQVAREIQASMLPPSGELFPDRPDLDCAAVMDAAAEVGGDFYDIFFLDDRHLFFAVADVAGKGIGAALFMARSMTLLRNEALKRRPLDATLACVNDALARGNEQATFVALFCGILDATSGTLRYANGGGGAPFLRSGGRWSRLPMPRGLVVGAIPGFAFEPARTRLVPGDELVLFSDGVTEARNAAGELFGEARLRAALEGSTDGGASVRVEAVRAAVLAFTGGALPADDLALLVLRRPAGL